MRVLEGLSGLRSIDRDCVLSIGNFDGVHRGHVALIGFARAVAPGSRLCIATFEPHPLTVLRPELAPPRLTPPDMKHALLEAMGVDDLVVLAPEPEILNLSAEQFWTILRDEVRPRHIIEGNSFTFGKDRGGTIERLQQWSTDSDISVHVVPPLEATLCDMAVVPVSSSIVRWLIEQGRARDAAICLGRPYALRGEVVKGHQRGRTIGVPTANLDIQEQLAPADGVYACRCTLAGQTYPAAVSVGTMPTFAGKNRRQIEAHLIGFDGDLYGLTIDVDLLDWVRDQRKFNGIEALKAGITRDLIAVRERQRPDPAGAPVFS